MAKLWPLCMKFSFKTLRFLFFVFGWMAFSALAHAQEVEEFIQVDTVRDYRVEVKLPDSLPGIDYLVDKKGRVKTIKVPREPRELLTGPSVYVDYGRMASFFISYESKYEAGLGFTFWEDFRLVGELGFMQ